MKDLHKNFDRSEIRDMLAIGIQTSICGWSIENALKNLKQAEENLKQAKYRFAIIQIMKDNGWTEWGVSDYVEYDVTGYSFVGTKEEYNRLADELDIPVEKRYTE